jgi:nucleoid-associated protein YgaU
MVRAKAPMIESKPEKAAAQAAVPSAAEKQPPVVEEVEIELGVKQARSSEPALERPGPSEVRAGPSEVQAEPAWQTIVVERGDTLGKLSSRIYGRSNERVIELIQKSNPGIKDPDHILPGQKLIFPPLPDSQQ